MRIDGIQGRPELNGKHGMTTRYVPDKGRFAVTVEGLEGEPPCREAGPRIAGQPASSPRQADPPTGRGPQPPCPTLPSRGVHAEYAECTQSARRVPNGPASR